MTILRTMKKALKLTNIVKLINFTLETNIGWLSFLPFLFRVLSNYIWTLWTLLPSFTWFLGPEFEGTLLRTLTLTWEHTIRHARRNRRLLAPRGAYQENSQRERLTSNHITLVASYS